MVEYISSYELTVFFGFYWILGSVSRAKFPVSLSNHIANHVGLTPRLLYSSTCHFPEGFTHLKTGWANRFRYSIWLWLWTFSYWDPFCIWWIQEWWISIKCWSTLFVWFHRTMSPSPRPTSISLCFSWPKHRWKASHVWRTMVSYIVLINTKSFWRFYPYCN